MYKIKQFHDNLFEKFKQHNFKLFMIVLKELSIILDIHQNTLTKYIEVLTYAGLIKCDRAPNGYWIYDVKAWDDEAVRKAWKKVYGKNIEIIPMNMRNEHGRLQVVNASVTVDERHGKNNINVSLETNCFSASEYIKVNGIEKVLNDVLRQNVLSLEATGTEGSSSIGNVMASRKSNGSPAHSSLHDSTPDKKKGGSVVRPFPVQQLPGKSLKAHSNKEKRAEQYEWIRENVPATLLLREMGVRYYQAKSGEIPFRCPLHDDHKPSAYVNEDTGMFKCHGCGKKGDLVQLYAYMHDVPNWQGLEWVMGVAVKGHKFGCMDATELFEISGQSLVASAIATEAVEVVEQESDEEACVAASGELPQLYAITTESQQESATCENDGNGASETNNVLDLTRSLKDKRHAQFATYQSQLNESEEAKQYLLSRGVKAPFHSWFGFDNEKQALVIPNTKDGDVVGFTYRSIRPDSSLRYWNSKSDPIYKKSECLLFLDKVQQSKTVALVEGVFDAIHLWQRGIPAIAMQGSSLTNGQAQAIRQALGEDVRVVIMPDNDTAGKIGLETTMDVLGRNHLVYQVHRIPEGYKDVAEYCCQMGGKVEHMSENECQ